MQRKFKIGKHYYLLYAKDTQIPYNTLVYFLVFFLGSQINIAPSIKQRTECHIMTHGMIRSFRWNLEHKLSQVLWSQSSLCLYVCLYIYIYRWYMNIYRWCCFVMPET